MLKVEDTIGQYRTLFDMRQMTILVVVLSVFV